MVESAVVRTDVFRETVDASKFGVVQKPLSTWERIYSIPNPGTDRLISGLEIGFGSASAPRSRTSSRASKRTAARSASPTWTRAPWASPRARA